jgi:hypothetical protein
LKIGKTLGIGTGTVRRVLMEQPGLFDVDVAEAALAPTTSRAGRSLGSPIGSTANPRSRSTTTSSRTARSASYPTLN